VFLSLTQECKECNCKTFETIKKLFSLYFESKCLKKTDLRDSEGAKAMAIKTEDDLVKYGIVKS